MASALMSGTYSREEVAKEANKHRHNKKNKKKQAAEQEDDDDDEVEYNKFGKKRDSKKDKKDKKDSGGGSEMDVESVEAAMKSKLEKQLAFWETQATAFIAATKLATNLVNVLKVRTEENGDEIPLADVGAVRIIDSHNIEVTVDQPSEAEYIINSIKQQEAHQAMDAYATKNIVTLSIPQLTTERKERIAKLAKATLVPFKQLVMRTQKDTVKTLKTRCGLTPDYQFKEEKKVRAICEAILKKAANAMSDIEKKIKN